MTSNFYLHSHDINWGSGSGQQSVTAYPTLGDTNSMWQIFGSIDSDWMDFKLGRPIKCDSVIRLKHCNTKKWLHSHSNHRAPVSSQQEVSGFGSSDDNTDYGDEWIIKCLPNKNKDKNKNNNDDNNNNDNLWIRGQTIFLRHKQTKHYLFTSKKADFNDQNCRNCPINGQLEISCVPKRLKGAKWITHHGVYFRPIDEVESFDDNEDISHREADTQANEGKTEL